MISKSNKKAYKVICKSGIQGWRARLRVVYNDFEDYYIMSKVYNIHKRLGYKTTRSAWNANPIVEGSVNPSDFRKVT